jgi:hypothetical protein
MKDWGITKELVMDRAWLQDLLGFTSSLPNLFRTKDFVVVVIIVVVVSMFLKT